MSMLLNSTKVLTGEINMSLNGIWYSDLRLLGGTFKAGDSVQLKTTDGSFSLSGTVAPDRVGEVLSVTYLRVIGGKGGMAKIASAKAFQNGLVSDVLNSLVSDAGETLSDTIDSSVLNTQLPNWTIVQSPVVYQLNILTKLYSWNWRFLPNGTLWVGAETYPDAPDFDYTQLDYDPINGFVPLGIVQPSLLPGYTVAGYKVSKVVHELQETSARTKFYQPQTSGDRSILNAVKAIVNSSLAPIDFFTTYSASIDSQSSDGSSVDITPDDSRLPGMQKIPFYSNLAGTTVKLLGGKVSLGWFGGDPTQPYAEMQSGSGEVVTEINLGGGGDNVATKADLTALISAIGSGLTSVSGGSVTWAASPPVAVCSQIVKAKRS